MKWNSLLRCVCGFALLIRLRVIDPRSHVFDILKCVPKKFSRYYRLRTRIVWVRILSTTHATCMSNHNDNAKRKKNRKTSDSLWNRDWKRKSMCCVVCSLMSYQERRKGSSKLLKTLMMMLSFVTEYISGPGNCPLIRIPCIQTTTTINFNSKTTSTHGSFEKLILWNRTKLTENQLDCTNPLADT